MVFENAQDREECYYVGLDEETGEPMKQVTYEPNAKVPNCGTLSFQREDHTIGNLLRHQLLTQDKVRFAAYQMPHPLLHVTHVRVETTDANLTPLMAVDRSFDALVTEFSQIDQRFKDEVEKRKADRGDVFE